MEEAEKRGWGQEEIGEKKEDKERKRWRQIEEEK